jgi:hypothetical protein
VPGVLFLGDTDLAAGVASGPVSQFEKIFCARQKGIKVFRRADPRAYGRNMYHP